MLHVNVAIRSALFALLCTLRAAMLPLENARAAFEMRARSAIAIGNRNLRLRKALAKAEANMEVWRDVMGSSRCGIEFRHLRDGQDAARKAVASLTWAIRAGEEDFDHALKLVEEARVRIAEVDTPAMRQRAANIAAIEQTLKLLD